MPREMASSTTQFLQKIIMIILFRWSMATAFIRILRPSPSRRCLKTLLQVSFLAPSMLSSKTIWSTAASLETGYKSLEFSGSCMSDSKVG